MGDRPARDAGEFYSARLLGDARATGTTREKTAEAVGRDGWMHTGDLAGCARTATATSWARIKDAVIPGGGENIYPARSREFLYQHPDIEDAGDRRPRREAARSLPGVRMRAGATPLDADAVRAYATGRPRALQDPRYVLVVDEFPMTVTGKIRKVQMRGVGPHARARVTGGRSCWHRDTRSGCEIGGSATTSRSLDDERRASASPGPGSG